MIRNSTKNLQAYINQICIVPLDNPEALRTASKKAAALLGNAPAFAHDIVQEALLVRYHRDLEASCRKVLGL
jgi:hypothetical protein